MNNLRKKSINMLCRLGKFGVGKSLTLGLYDFEIPNTKKVIVSKNGKQ